MGLGCRWGSRSLQSNGLDNFREGEGFYGCIWWTDGIRIIKHLGQEGFLLQVL